jgi:ADP-L-glycero-D-manno-heptose 6-epimerase
MIVVTGGAGFIGSNLVAALEARKNSALVVCDRLGANQKWRNIAKRELQAIVPPQQLIEWLTEHRTWIEVVFHLGAISSTTETDADLIVDTNYTFSQTIWKWCAENRVRFVYASSAATYGSGETGFDDDVTSEGLASLRPLNAYGWSKHLFDRWVVRQVERGYPCPPQWVGLKFFNVYGPNEYHKGAMQSVVAKLYHRIAAGGHAELFKSHHPDYADGGQMRDFVAVEDCVKLLLWLADTPKVNGIFNCGSGTARSFLDLTLATYAAMGVIPDIRYVDTPVEIRPNYQYFTEAKMARIAALGFPFEPTPLETGVGDYVRNFLASTTDRYR